MPELIWEHRGGWIGDGIPGGGGSAIHSAWADPWRNVFWVGKGNEAKGATRQSVVFLQQRLLDQDVFGNKANRCQVPRDLYTTVK